MAATSDGIEPRSHRLLRFPHLKSVSMRVFDVFVNDEKLCRAGVGDDGVLDTIVTWVKLTGEAAEQARRSNAPVEETRLHVGGLSNDTHQRWVQRMLTVGDRVTVEVASARSADAPSHSRKQNRKKDEERERRYFLRLKEKYEPSRKRRGQDRPGPTTTFLNVDLDIWSRAPLDDLVTAFGRKVVVLYVGKEGRQYGAHLEVGVPPADADRTIRRFVTLVDSLPRSPRKIWDSARVRQFNVGIQAGASPPAYELRLQPATVEAVAGIGARIAVTIYAPDEQMTDQTV
jgi:hypothetical protein